LGARIIAVSDVFDAMTSLRPHRKAMHPEEALIEMERGMGKQFDPHLMDIFIKGKIYNLTV
jgi:HD-GYP domain-containing protein (c-di-GMP phosphodiesterase class II)